MAWNSKTFKPTNNFNSAQYIISLKDNYQVILSDVDDRMIIIYADTDDQTIL